MVQHIVSVDIGTTNIKAGVFTADMKALSFASSRVEYQREGHFIEFDPEAYWLSIKKTIAKAIEASAVSPKSILSIGLTGQGESFVILGKTMEPLRNGISWMDDRSGEEAEMLKSAFPFPGSYEVTGIPEIIPTWTITKLLWIKRHEPEVFARIAKVLLIKDFVVYKLTGSFLGEYSTHNFSCYLDITKKDFWTDILDYVGIQRDCLPQLMNPGETAGTVLPGLGAELGFSSGVTVNIGGLDHYCGMIGTGNIKPGILSDSTGTVLALNTMVPEPLINEFRIPCHCGVVRDTYVLMPICESGGVCLEWFAKDILGLDDFSLIDKAIETSYGKKNDVIFLPYINGTNSPEFNSNASGVFFGLRSKHTKYDLARAVMEGVGFIMRKNLEVLAALGINPERIISTGGGAKSAVWNRMKADITGKKIAVPAQKEAGILGAAMLAAVSHNVFGSIEEAAEKAVTIKSEVVPDGSGRYDAAYRKFVELYTRLEPVFDMK